MTKTKNLLKKCTILIACILFLIPMVLPMPFFYDENTEAMYSAIFDPRIPGWYEIYDWEVKVCMNKKGLDYVPSGTSNGGTVFYGKIIGAYGYKFEVIDPEDPTEMTNMYEISYFIMAEDKTPEQTTPSDENTEYEIILVKGGKKEGIKTEYCSGLAGCSDYISGLYYEDDFDEVHVKFKGEIQFKGAIILKEE